MKKFDSILLAILIVEMLVAFMMKTRMSIPLLVILTTVVPMLILAVLFGRLVYHYQRKVSFFYSFVTAIVATLVIFFYSFLFPWETLLSGGDAMVSYTPGIGNLLSTFLTEMVLISLVTLLTKSLAKRNSI